MAGVIEPGTMFADDLPSVWTPVQTQLTPEEKAKELEEQATASLVWAAGVPEAILRLLLRETEIVLAYEPPPGYDPDAQGEWDAALVAFTFRRRIRLESEDRSEQASRLVYDFGEAGTWEFVIEAERVNIARR